MAQRPTLKRVAPVLLVFFAIAAGLVANHMLSQRAGQERETDAGLRRATPIPDPRPLTPFALSDHRGAPFTERDLIGHWTLLSFGYTHCPDICPTTLQMLSRVEARLSSAGQAPLPRVVFVSVDPERDTPERLAGYVPYFSPRFTGVTGSREALTGLTRQLGVIFEKAGDGGAGYLVNHSASIVLVDPQGRFRALFSAPHDAETMAEDFRLIATAG